MIKRLFSLSIISFIIMFSMMFTFSFSDQSGNVGFPTGDSTEVVASVLPDTQPTVDNGIVMYDLIKIFYVKAVDTVEAVKSNGMSASGLISLIFIVILPGLVLLLRAFIFILRAIKTRTGKVGDARIDAIIKKLTPIQRFLEYIKTVKKKE